jgi:GT2 family glycosyltransferase
MVDHVVVVNDGEEFKENWNSGFRSLHVSKDPETTLVYYQNPINLGVAKSKNLALKHLLDLGCDHIFLMEDDIYIKDNSVFQRYIEASKISGIQHFNFSQHGLMNKTHHGRSLPNPLTFIDYGSIKIPLYLHCVGAFSYYSRKCLETVGLMDENYYNACEHVDHTYEIIKAGMHPPFWNFADIENSWQYLGDEPWSLEQSTISSKSNHREIVAAADKVFMAKHGHLPRATPMTTEEGLVNSLKELKKNYGK